MRVLPSGSAGVLVEVDSLAEVLALHGLLRQHPPHGVVDLVPAARTVLLVLDPSLTDASAVAAAVRSLPDPSGAGSTPEPQPARETGQGTGQNSGPGPGPGPAPGPVEVPVRYDGEDLREVARLIGLEPREVVQRHTSTLWVVAFSGFAPGFGYAVPVDGGPWDVPRRDESRTRVPAGAVGLAGGFTGVYPRESPGGWQLIGRTEAVMFDPDRDPPALLRPGTTVRFVETGGAW